MSETTASSETTPTTPDGPRRLSPAERRRRRILAAVFLLGAGIVASLILGAVRRDELKFRVWLNGETFLQGRPIVMRLAVQNVSDRPVRAAQWTPFEDVHECYIFEDNPLTMELYYEHVPQPLYVVPFTGEAPVEEIGSDQTIDFRCNIGRAFALNRPGKYRLHVSYVREPGMASPLLRPLAKLMGSVLEAEVATFEIQPMRYDTQLPPPPAAPRTAPREQ